MSPSHQTNGPPPRNPGHRSGFALVIVLSLMILLTLLAVGLLTLGSVALRTSARDAHVAEARANARLALILALGDLQRLTGPDTRITARADVFDEENPPVTGVWKSWEGSDHAQSGTAVGRPIAPGDYPARKKERLLGWLTSGPAGAKPAIPDAKPGRGKATLVGSGSVGSGDGRGKLEVHLTTQPIAARLPGRFAWWISGNNQKAVIPKPYQAEPDAAGRWAIQLKSHAVPDPEVFRMESLLDDPDPAAKACTTATADLIARKSDLPVSRESYHDLTAYADGLQVNVATGGWKKDFSLLTENWTRAGTSNLPLFRLNPATSLKCNLPTPGNPVAPRSMFYPWAAYRGNTGMMPIYQHGAVASWEHLKDYILAYRDKGITITPAGNAKIVPVSTAIDGDMFNFLHRVRVLPVIARIQWVFSHWSAKSGDGYEPRLLLTPVVTMWNPYNVEMTFSAVPLTFTIPKPLPVALTYSVGGTACPTSCLTTGSTNYTAALSASDRLIYEIGAPFTLRPGETRVFSPSETTVPSSRAALALQPGYRSKAGHYFPIKSAAGSAVFPASATLRAEVKFDTAYMDAPGGSTTTEGVGIYLDMSYGGARHLAYRMIYTRKVASEVYPAIKGLAESPPLSSITSSPSPFLTTIFGARMASRTHIPAKGFVQSSPLVNYTAMGGKDVAEVSIARHYTGTGNPVNSPFDYSFERLAPAGDSLLPNQSDTTGRGYIVTGFTKADGLSRCVIAELPTRPLASLMELQHWDLRYENPIPPFALNLIGNSDASPLIPSNAVVNAADAGLATNLQHDDSYCANHLLFDDWFFSSITRDPAGFGRDGTLQKTYDEFLNGAKPLANPAYQPLAADRAEALATGSTAGLFAKHANKADSWQTIASRLEVAGMFNVNSTSVPAWRALLGHARGRRIPYLSESGTSWNVALSKNTDHAMSRFTVAGDTECSDAGSSGAFPEAAQFTGYRKFETEMLDELAERIVRQVRLRGPFLSLSEFVNRQLSSGDLALAGAVQTALNELEKSHSNNPYQGITSVISNTSSPTPPSSADAEYRFPAAAAGNCTYGLPGWTRQADVLRPLAPVLTVRDDTFTIRAYGEARDAAGSVLAHAVCEAVVSRGREFVHPSDAADCDGLPKHPINQALGRRYRIIALRWLGESEI
ncbi:MAG: hypothetical protein J0M04_10870 [Verrucomicrobia bacterium]|nr:hypothetical protein [Verrucomicrobiota bacterium]